MPVISHDFEHAAVKALGNQQLRANFRRVMTGLMTKRAAQFPDQDEIQLLRDPRRRHQGSGPGQIA